MDWYNVQFYNQGKEEYTTCGNLLEKSSGAWPGTSLWEIAEAMGEGVNGMRKLVVGKPSERDQAENGYMTPEVLKGCLDQADGEAKRRGGVFGGAMQWQWDGSGGTKNNFLRLAGAN